jgi:CRISPR/Cas system CSM-associated protein Csm3 (group 7 of RAMP superfamily)
MSNVAVPRPDFVHLHSERLASDGTRKHMPILPGTSLAGALRARAFKIARLLAPSGDGEVASKLIDEMFGREMKKAPMPEASRIIVHERLVSGVENMSVQNRVSLDRFTSGTRDGALFSEQPLFGGTQSQVTVDLHLENPREHEIGLLLLLLKDLWTGDLPLGGEISVGRGRLRGKSCHLEHRNGQVQDWELIANGTNALSVITGERQKLEHYVSSLHTYLIGANHGA